MFIYNQNIFPERYFELYVKFKFNLFLQIFGIDFPGVVALPDEALLTFPSSLGEVFFRFELTIVSIAIWNVSYIRFLQCRICCK